MGNAAVSFAIANPTGGGESISPVVAYTDATGQAKATFTSGSISSGAGGVIINARVVGTTVTAPPIAIVIGGTAGSVVIGLGSEITIVNATTYALPMSVLVADSSGSAVSGALVSLKLWPVQYFTGSWYNALAYDPDKPDKVRYQPYISGTFGNDDTNENLIKDPTENSDPYGALRPPNSAAGSLPATVTTNEHGVANFDLYYLKGSAIWIRDRVLASTMALGTETSSSITFSLPAEKKEAEAGHLPDATYPIDLTVAASGSITYNVPVWTSPYGTTIYATQSIYSSIVSNLYTFAAPATKGIYYDYITAGDGGTTFAIVPVRILVQ